MDDLLFIDWIKTNAHVSMEISIALDNQRLRPKKTSFSLSESYPKRWDYYESLVKLTNNRLGIFHKNEGYLFYTLAESLKVAAMDSYIYHRQRV